MDFKKKFGRLKWQFMLAAVPVALVLGITAWFLLQALLGAFALACAGAVALAVVNYAPVYSLKLANARIRALQKEAMRHPIETLYTVKKERTQEREEIKDKITVYDGKRTSFAAKVETFKERWPQDAHTFVEQLAGMDAKLERMRGKYAKLVQTLQEFDGVIERSEAIYDMSVASLEMKDLDALFNMNFQQELLTKTALGAVTDTMNQAFASMRADMLDDFLESPQMPTAAAVQQQPAQIQQSKTIIEMADTVWLKDKEKA